MTPKPDTALTVRVPGALHRQIAVLAAQQGRRVGAVTEELLRQALAKKPSK